jgi:hypothetical protein
MTAFIKTLCTNVLLVAIFLFRLICHVARRGWALSSRLLAHLRLHTAPRIGRLIRRAYVRVALVIGRVLPELCVRTVLLIGHVVRRIRRQPAGDSKVAVPVTTWTRRHVR